MYHADNIILNVLDLARRADTLFESHGRVLYDRCRDLTPSRPVTFLQESTVVASPPWDPVRGSIAFQFHTNEPNSLLMYSLGAEGVMDFFALEILEGYLYLSLNIGSGTRKIQPARDRVNDGLPHSVALHLEDNQKRGRIQLDGHTERFRLRGKSETLDLKGALYVGGMSTRHGNRTLPREVWTAVLGHGFVGCLEDLEVNDESVDLFELARAQDVIGIGHYCHSQPPQCDSYPCAHNGQCSEGWNRYICDCSGTSYTGDQCQQRE